MKSQVMVFRVCPQIHPSVSSSIPQCIIGIEIPTTWKNRHTVCITCSVRATMVEKAKWKPLELTLPGKIVKQNSITFLEGFQRLVPPSRISRIQE